MLSRSVGSYDCLLKMLKILVILQCLFICIRAELKGDLFSSREALIELYRSENICMGLLRTYMEENNVEHKYLQAWDFTIKYIQNTKY